MSLQVRKFGLYYYLLRKNKIQFRYTVSDFTKLGGFSIVGPFLKSENSDIVRMAAEVIGVATQNHPRCQETVLADENILSSLFDILKSPERHDNVKLKAVFAISCMYRIRAKSSRLQLLFLF